MATFKYISKDMSAKTIRGTLEADDRNDLVRKLKETKFIFSKLPRCH